MGLQKSVLHYFKMYLRRRGKFNAVVSNVLQYEKHKGLHKMVDDFYCKGVFREAY